MSSERKISCKDGIIGFCSQQLVLRGGKRIKF